MILKLILCMRACVRAWSSSATGFDLGTTGFVKLGLPSLRHITFLWSSAVDKKDTCFTAITFFKILLILQVCFNFFKHHSLETFLPSHTRKKIFKLLTKFANWRRKKNESFRFFLTSILFWSRGHLIESCTVAEKNNFFQIWLCALFLYFIYRRWEDMNNTAMENCIKKNKRNNCKIKQGK